MTCADAKGMVEKRGGGVQRVKDGVEAMQSRSVTAPSPLAEGRNQYVFAKEKSLRVCMKCQFYTQT